MSLLVEAHEPKTFWNKDQPGQPCAVHPSSQRREKLRNLIVDLAIPTFMDGDEILADGLHMFRPTGVNSDVYSAALVILDEFMACPATQLGVVVNKYGDFILPVAGLTVYAGCNPYNLYEEFMKCNHDQKSAIRRVLLAKDYSLLQGFPGTGKTSVLCLLARTLMARGEKVLISSYTHSAVDNLLSKLRECGVTPHRLVRIGTSATTPDSGRDFVLDTQSSGITLADLQERCSSACIVACTVLTAFRSSLMRTFTFNWCIIDEAGQIIEPAAVGALLLSERFVLVGDHFQLPPLVVSQEAKEAGMGVSLLQRLIEAHPHASSCLTTQYRMSEEIMSVSNSLFYAGRMRCGLGGGAGSGACQHAYLHLPMLLNLPLPTDRTTPALDSGIVSSSGNSINSVCRRGSDSNGTALLLSHRRDWLFECLHQERGVVFLNTDPMFPRLADETEIDSTGAGNSLLGTTVEPRKRVEVGCSSSVACSTGGNFRISSNDMEANLVGIIVSALSRCGINTSSDVGVITPYRAQVRIIEARLHSDPMSRTAECRLREEGGISMAAPIDCGSCAQSPMLIVTDLNTAAASAGPVEVSTVDKFQGRDKQIIIMSTVQTAAAETVRSRDLS